MDIDNLHMCPCLRSGVTNHPPDHVICCKCIKCFVCGAWIRKDRWAVHSAQPCAPQSLPQPPSPVKEVFQDSLEQAINDLGFAEEELFGEEFRRQAREFIDQLIYCLNIGSGLVPYSRTNAWRHVMAILMSTLIDEDEKVKALKDLFDPAQWSEELDVQLTEVVFNVSTLFPSNTPTG